MIKIAKKKDVSKIKLLPRSRKKIAKGFTKARGRAPTKPELDKYHGMSREERGKKQKRITKKKTKQKKKYLVNLKREKEMAGKGWKVARTKKYTDQPKKAIGKKGYPYAVLNKKKHYESFYTWKEKPSKKRKPVKTKTPKQKEKYEKKVEKRIRKGKDIGWGW